MTPQCVCVVIHWSTDMLFMIYVQTHLLTRWNLPTICGGCPFVHSPSSSNHYSSLFCLLFYIPSAVIRPMWHFIDRLWLSLLWSVSINILIGCTSLTKHWRCYLTQPNITHLPHPRGRGGPRHHGALQPADPRSSGLVQVVRPRLP